MSEGIRGPTEKQPASHVSDTASKSSGLAAAMETPVKTLSQLKEVLIKDLGKKEGMKLYNHFMTSLVESMLSQIRQTQQSADQATKAMGQDQPS